MFLTTGGIMQYANTDKGKSTAEPKLPGRCPMCSGELVAKCGEINAWHWAHKSLEDCDTWSEGETQWHLDWKSFFPPQYTEVTVTKDGIKHRADVRLNSGGM
jgi:competence protein CoiA